MSCALPPVQCFGGNPRTPNGFRWVACGTLLKGRVAPPQKPGRSPHCPWFSKASRSVSPCSRKTRHTGKPLGAPPTARPVGGANTTARTLPPAPGRFPTNSRPTGRDRTTQLTPKAACGRRERGRVSGATETPTPSTPARARRAQRDGEAGGEGRGRRRHATARAPRARSGAPPSRNPPHQPGHRRAGNPTPHPPGPAPQVSTPGLTAPQ